MAQIASKVKKTSCAMMFALQLVLSSLHYPKQCQLSGIRHLGRHSRNNHYHCYESIIMIVNHYHCQSLSGRNVPKKIKNDDQEKCVEKSVQSWSE